MNDKPGILEVIRSYISNQDTFPILNPEAAKIQSEIVKQSPDLEAVKNLVKTDPTLTSEILRVANSSYYKGLDQVSTIKEAAMRLGQNELFNIIMRVIHRQMFISKNPLISGYQKLLWDHSVACAVASLWLTRHLKMTDLLPQAYIAGLLHDIGKLCILSGLEQMMVKEKNAPLLTPELVGQIQVFQHQQMGFELLTRWRLPDQYCRVARDHHIEAFDTTDSLLLVVRLANNVCNIMEKSASKEDRVEIMGSLEADLLSIKDTGLALLEIALEDAGFFH